MVSDKISPGSPSHIASHELSQKNKNIYHKITGENFRTEKWSKNEFLWSFRPKE